MCAAWLSEACTLFAASMICVVSTMLSFTPTKLQRCSWCAACFFGSCEKRSVRCHRDWILYVRLLVALDERLGKSAAAGRARSRRSASANAREAGAFED